VNIAFSVSGKDLSSPVHEKFGRAPRFLIFDTDAKQFSLVENPAASGALGAGLKAAETVVRSGAKAAVAGEFGPKAENMLRAAHVEMYTSGPVAVREALQRLFGIAA
jgi:predicted Fe-Mo cluster-binding NifX family protein